LGHENTQFGYRGCGRGDSQTWIFGRRPF
jgi:hypothetical protein